MPSSKTRRTVGNFRCPACGAVGRMLIVWPFWHCVDCDARLIPADDSDPSPFRYQIVGRLVAQGIENDAPVWFI